MAPCSRWRSRRRCRWPRSLPGRLASRGPARRRSPGSSPPTCWLRRIAAARARAIAASCRRSSTCCGYRSRRACRSAAALGAVGSGPTGPLAGEWRPWRREVELGVPLRARAATGSRPAARCRRSARSSPRCAAPPATAPRSPTPSPPRRAPPASRSPAASASRPPGPGPKIQLVVALLLVPVGAAAGGGGAGVGAARGGADACRVAPPERAPRPCNATRQTPLLHATSMRTGSARKRAVSTGIHPTAHPLIAALRAENAPTCDHVRRHRTEKWGIVLQSGKSGVGGPRNRTGVAGLLPLRHFGPKSSPQGYATVGIPWSLRLLAGRKEPAQRAGQVPRGLLRAASFSPRRPSPASRSGPPSARADHRARARGPEPALRASTGSSARFSRATRFDIELDARRPRDAPQPLLDARGRSRRRSSSSGVGDHLEVWDRGPLARASRTRSTPRSTRSRRALAILLDMTRTHVPVLAGELIELARPAPGRDRGRLHVRRRRPRAPGRRPDRARPGRSICIDRDPAAEERFDELARRGGLRDALPAHGLRGGARAARRRGPPGRPRLPRPRHVLDAGGHPRARLLLLLRRAARHAHGPRARSSTRARS